MRSQPACISLLTHAIQRCEKNTDIDDQTHFSRELYRWMHMGQAQFIRAGEIPIWSYAGHVESLTFRILDPWLFQTGQVTASLWDSSDRDRYPQTLRAPVLLHANWMVISFNLPHTGF
jgi:hypothetical protein